MWGHHSTAEWGGRFSAVDNRFRNELLDITLEDGPAFQEYVRSVGNYAEISKPRSQRANDYSKMHTTASAANGFREPTPPEQVERRKFMGDDEILRHKRVMEHLATLCRDEAARRSLHEFQTTYARLHRRPDLMPLEGNRIEKLMGRVGNRLSFRRRSASEDD